MSTVSNFKLLWSCKLLNHSSIRLERRTCNGGVAGLTHRVSMSGDDSGQ